jgi:hypothetical protein
MKVRILVPRLRRRSSSRSTPEGTSASDVMPRHLQEASDWYWQQFSVRTGQDDAAVVDGLEDGDHIECPLCRRWHRVSSSLSATGPHPPLFYFCGDRTYQAGRRGETCSYRLRKPPR